MISRTCMSGFKLPYLMKYFFSHCEINVTLLYANFSISTSITQLNTNSNLPATKR